MLAFQYFILISIFVFLLLWWYYTSLTNNSNDLTTILNKKICPKCHHKIDETDIDKKSGGCSGTENIAFSCSYCNYSNSFNLPSSSCGNGSFCSSNKCKL